MIKQWTLSVCFLNLLGIKNRFKSAAFYQMWRYMLPTPRSGSARRVKMLTCYILREKYLSERAEFIDLSPFLSPMIKNVADVRLRSIYCEF